MTLTAVLGEGCACRMSLMTSGGDGSPSALISDNIYVHFGPRKNNLGRESSMKEAQIPIQPCSSVMFFGYKEKSYGHFIFARIT